MAGDSITKGYSNPNTVANILEGRSWTIVRYLRKLFEALRMLWWIIVSPVSFARMVGVIVAEMKKKKQAEKESSTLISATALH